MTTQPNHFVCFGEVLMDQFLAEKKIGGAPLNLAVWLSKLKQSATMVSGVGTDVDGNQLLEFLEERWEINIGDEDEKKKILLLDFIN